MKIINKCKDYEILKENLNEDTLKEIDEVLIQYEDWKTKGDEDYTHFEDYYGNGNTIEWYEGLMETEEFIKEIRYIKEEEMKRVLLNKIKVILEEEKNIEDINLFTNILYEEVIDYKYNGRKYLIQINEVEEN